MIQTKPSVLLVDDIDANLLALEAQLANLDCQLLRAKSGNEALRQLLKREFAMMLLDVQMPEMDGYEVARLARENPLTRNVPIIFVSALHETEESLLLGYGSGAVDFLFKPVNPQVLRSKVQVFLDLYVSRRGLADEIIAHKSTLAELEAFNYSVSHDLRAPLRSLDGFSQALLEDYGDRLDAEAQDHLKRIRGSAQRMGQLIDDLLQLSKIRRAEIKLQPVDLSALAELVVAELRGNEPDRNVEFVVRSQTEVQGDPGLLRIVLENLLRNAWKFTGKKQKGRIELGKRIEAKRTVYMISDNGAGFDPSFANKLFRPFERLHSSTEFEGTGIGLAIVDRIIQRHGGRVWAEGVPDQGATFFFTVNTA
jgi:signal transduction histidine kinase